MLARLPKVLGVGEARKNITRMLDEAGRGETFIIKGTGDREVLMIDAGMFRNFQDAYMELVGELETLRVLEDEEAVEALRTVSADEPVGTPGGTFTVDEVESMIGEDGEFDGEGAQ